MAKLIDGKAVSANVRTQVAEEVEALKKQGVTPGLAVVIVGDDPASRTYVNNKKKACAQTGIYSEEYALPATTTQDELMELIRTLKDVYKRQVENLTGTMGNSRSSQSRMNPIMALSTASSSAMRLISPKRALT